MGGVGKTALVSTVATQMRKSFDCIFWRSLQNVPPLELIVKQCLRFLADQQPADLPEDLSEQLTLLIQYVRSRRCLLVLDNVESILHPGRPARPYPAAHETYCYLIKLPRS